MSGEPDALLPPSSNSNVQALDLRLVLGIALREKLGSGFLCDEAAGEYERAYRGYRRELGEDDPRTRMALDCLLFAVTTLGACHENQSWYIDAIRSGERPAFAKSMSSASVAAHLGYAGQHELAVTVLRSALQDSNGDDPEQLSELELLAESLVALSRRDEAAQVYGDLATRRASVFGSDHPDTLLASFLQCFQLLRASDPERALPLAHEALSLHRAVLGPLHLNTLAAQALLVSALGRLGQHDEELVNLREIIQAHQKMGPLISEREGTYGFAECPACGRAQDPAEDTEGAG